MTIEKILDDCANTIRQQEAALLAEQKHNEMLMAEIEALKNRELTDEEINKLWAKSHEDGIAMQQGFTTQQHYFAHLILKKETEK